MRRSGVRFPQAALCPSVFADSAGTEGRTELRNRERVLGTTAEYRRDLRIRYVDPKPAPLAAVVNVEDFRDL
jgi:hypothetical protein